MYVNERTLDMGEPGIAAIKELLRRGAAAGIVPPVEIVVVD
jgi:predicted solute-binding protein